VLKPTKYTFKGQLLGVSAFLVSAILSPVTASQRGLVRYFLARCFWILVRGVLELVEAQLALFVSSRGPPFSASAIPALGEVR
jgi:hypothetical protein